MLNEEIKPGTLVKARGYHGTKILLIGGSHKAYDSLEGLDSLGYQAGDPNNPSLQYDIDHENVLEIVTNGE